jgi:hypothetical protein
MGDYILLTVLTLLALGAGALARHGWLAKDQGYFFMGAVLLAGLVVAVFRVTAKILRRWRKMSN